MTQKSYDLKWRGKVVTAKEKAGAVRGLELGTEHLLGESRKQVPLEEATLERSGTPSVDRGALKAAVSFDTPYAVRQHEEMTWRHDPGRNAKYLENPYYSEQDVILGIIAAELRRALQ